MSSYDEKILDYQKDIKKINKGIILMWANIFFGWFSFAYLIYAYFYFNLHLYFFVALLIVNTIGHIIGIRAIFYGYRLKRKRKQLLTLLYCLKKNEDLYKNHFNNILMNDPISTKLN